MRVLVVQHEDDAPAGLGRGVDRRPRRAVLDVPPMPSRRPAARRRSTGTPGWSSSAVRWAPTTTRPRLARRRRKALVARGGRRGAPVLGICLGHQLAAVALGGDGRRSHPAARQIGVSRRGLDRGRAADPVFGELAARRRGPATPAVQWNNDVVTEAPAGSTVLARRAQRCRPGRSGSARAPGASSCTRRSAATWSRAGRRPTRRRRWRCDADSARCEPRAAGGLAAAGRRVRRPAGGEPGFGMTDDGRQPRRAGWRGPGSRDVDAAAGRRRRARAATPTTSTLLVEAAAGGADPDVALHRPGSPLAAARRRCRPAPVRALRRDEGCAPGWPPCCGASPALGDHLARTRDWRELARPALGTGLAADGAPRLAERARPTADAADDALRRRLPARLLRHRGPDLTGDLRLRRGRGRALRPGRRHARGRAGRRPRRAAGEPRPCRLAVIAMGKCGGRELNYVSDVDVDLRRRAGRRAPTTAGAARGRHGSPRR